MAQHPLALAIHMRGRSHTPRAGWGQRGSVVPRHRHTYTRDKGALCMKRRAPGNAQWPGHCYHYAVAPQQLEPGTPTLAV
eukprot:scaffold2600_cov103-Isochrysis_galbana.AAC.6